jgi:hypothetical protein
MIDPATFGVDNPLPDGACWFRIVTNAKHITRDKTLHSQAFKSQFTPPDTPKAWSHELSGAARCFFATVQDAENYCEAFVQNIRNRYLAQGKTAPSFLQFAGLVCRDASSLRFQLKNFETDTAYTPDGNDTAHADFVTFGTTDDQSLKPIEQELRERLRLVLPPDVQILIAE